MSDTSDDMEIGAAQYEASFCIECGDKHDRFYTKLNRHGPLCLECMKMCQGDESAENDQFGVGA